MLLFSLFSYHFDHEDHVWKDTNETMYFKKLFNCHWILFGDDNDRISLFQTNTGDNHLLNLSNDRFVYQIFEKQVVLYDLEDKRPHVIFQGEWELNTVSTPSTKLTTTSMQAPNNPERPIECIEYQKGEIENY